MPAVWELVFMLVILKIPAVYLCWVVWWAIKAEPRPPLEPALTLAPADSDPGPWPGRRPRRSPRPRRGGPHGGSSRRYERARTKTARALR